MNHYVLGSIVGMAGVLLGVVSGCNAERPPASTEKPIEAAGSAPVVAGAPGDAASEQADGSGAREDAQGENVPLKDASKDAQTPTLANAVPPGGEGEMAPADAPDDAVASAATPEEDEATTGPRKVLILGDSLAATGFGALLERKLDAHPDVNCFRKGKSASGLARPDFFDWLAEGKRQVELRDPDLVVVIMGGNDGQDLTPRRGTGRRRVPWQHEDWEAAYRSRMDEFLTQIAGPDRRVLWLGLPTMGLRSLEKKLTLIRRIQAEAVEALGAEQASYLDTAPFVSEEDGRMRTHAQVGGRGRPKQIRAEDRIHFTMSGSEYFADVVYPQVLEVLGLPDHEGQAD